MLTKEDVRKALPLNLKSAATDSLVDALNDLPLDYEYAQSIRDNFLSYANVLRDGKYKIEDYANAVSYITFKMMGFNNQESYARTFPDRYQEHVAKNRSSKEISSFVAAYNKGKLVNAIWEQALIPTWLLNQDVLQKAINKQVELMDGAKSEMVQHLAAKTLIETLKKPESKEVNLNIGAVEDKGVEELRALMVSLAERQKEAITSGISTREIAHQKLMIDVTPEEE